MFARALKFLEALSPPVLLLLLTGSTCVIGLFDFLAGSDASFSAIYLFPIGVAAWFLGRPAAYALAILSSVLWLGGDIQAGARYASVLVPMWNLAVRFTVFVFAAQLITELRKLHDDLEARAAERAAKLTTEIAARERLERELLHVSEREQRRVAHDIHDSLCQHLTGTAFASEIVAEKLRSQGLPEAHDAARVVELIEQGISLSRNLARGLSSVELSNTGLMEALEDFTSSTSELFKISCRFECPLPFLIHDPQTANHLYRITQEAVGNAIKHGQAKNIVVELEHSHSGKVLRISDDGSGLPPSHMNSSGMGLRIMSYRAQLIGGKLNIRRRGTTGTMVSCLLPLDRAS